MSELKATTAQEIVQNEKDCDYMDELFGGVKMPPTQVYLKSETDAVIAEKDKVISEKDEEIRRLHRALYKACANWACAKMEYEQFDSNMSMCGFITDKEVSWESMMKKCLKKEEEFR